MIWKRLGGAKPELIILGEELRVDSFEACCQLCQAVDITVLILDKIPCAEGRAAWWRLEPTSIDIVELLKRRVGLGPRRWPEIVKSALKEAIRCPLGLVCYPSCFWWQDGKCIFPSGAKQEPKEKRSKFEKTAEEETEPICPS